MSISEKGKLGQIGGHRLEPGAAELISSQNKAVVPGSVVSDQHVAVTTDLPSTISGGQSSQSLLSWHPAMALPFIFIVPM
jgi:hypothetical protein